MSNLFADQHLRDVLDLYNKKVREEIEAMDFDEYSAMQEEETVEALFGKYRPRIPALLLSKIKHYEREPLFSSVPSFSLTIAVPYEGDFSLFRFTPSRSRPVVPRAEIADNHIRFNYVYEEGARFNVREKLKKDLALMREYLDWVEEDINGFLPTLRQTIVATVRKRNEKLQMASFK
jgi:hypothetical protein